MTDGALLGKLPTFLLRLALFIFTYVLDRWKLLEGKGFLFLGQCLNGRLLE